LNSIYDSLSVNSSDGSSSASPNILTEEKRAASKDDLLQTGNNSNFKTHRRYLKAMQKRNQLGEEPDTQICLLTELIRYQVILEIIERILKYLILEYSEHPNT
jgi:hypothetical protein